jgi:hypothetical protein
MNWSEILAATPYFFFDSKESSSVNQMKQMTQRLMLLCSCLAFFLSWHSTCRAGEQRVGDSEFGPRPGPIRWVKDYKVPPGLLELSAEGKGYVDQGFRNLAGAPFDPGFYVLYDEGKGVIRVRATKDEHRTMEATVQKAWKRYRQGIGKRRQK